MGLYWKAAAGVLIGLILGLSVERKDLGLLLSMAVCVLVGTVTVVYLGPVREFLEELKALGDLEGLGILMRALGVGMVTELTALLCKDSGRESMGQALRMLGSAVILWLSLPLFRGFLDLIQRILGGI